MCSYVSAVGEADVQTMGNNHNSLVMGHGSRGSWVTWVLGQFTDGSDGSALLRSLRPTLPAGCLPSKPDINTGTYGPCGILWVYFSCCNMDSALIMVALCNRADHYIFAL